MTNIIPMLTAAAVVGGTGIVIAVLLGIADKKFKVEVNEKELAVRDALPGNNCGGCGFPGCDGLAAAIAKGEAAADSCPVGGSAVAEKISGIMGTEIGNTVKRVAYVHCSGTCEIAQNLYEYVGPKDCRIAMNSIHTGPKSCTYGCMGFGSCVDACPFDAIEIVDGIARVNKEACKACGKCVEACPKHLIELVPETAKQHVGCNSNEMGKDIRSVCKMGCMGCGVCVRTCPEQAITVTDCLAHIDYELCTNCGLCKEKCPVHIIQP